MKIHKKHIAVTPKPNHQGRKPHVVILLDASSSMGGYRSEVVSTFNEYVQSVKNTAKTISLYTFTDESRGGIKELVFKESPSRMKRFSIEDYLPSGMTPLFDAMGAVINRFRPHGDNASDGRPVQFVTHTDGCENLSTSWSKLELDALISKQTEDGWMFVYLAEGLQGRETMRQFVGLKMSMSNATRAETMGMVGTVTCNYASSNIGDPARYTVDGSDEVDLDAGEKISPVVTSGETA